MNKPSDILRLDLSSDDLVSIECLLSKLQTIYKSVEEWTFLEEVRTLTKKLPVTVQDFLSEFQSSSAPVCLISGYQVNDAEIGLTPEDWTKRDSSLPALLRVDLLFVLLSSMLGEVFTWQSEQKGHLINDVFPIKKHKDQQISTGACQPIYWHTEDAFLVDGSRPKYLGLFCIRNSDVATTVGSVSKAVSSLPLKVQKVLSERRFLISPDEAHIEGDSVKHPRVRKAIVERERVAIISREDEKLVVRLDPYFTKCLDAEAESAMKSLVAAIDSDLGQQVLEPGHCMFLKNDLGVDVAVHGRQSFSPSFNGYDRWCLRSRVSN
ncbi:TauD/TfdA family dioxygenase [Oculatella sp. LEGE 06141]|uniref:TauD/TfdA family dioxygenase n=1 Tax=Oculatella sp. LEGE 06141 TaxID=1828648 RepID=UPI0018829BD8|nr:TauD/TfdA family dioxygenase [Oculatella sp. LEGE 06141]MBE9180228.1 TauD/TfdA family dioxygenase [Oculatella sp. LEGE 06141]